MANNSQSMRSYDVLNNKHIITYHINKSSSCTTFDQYFITLITLPIAKEVLPSSPYILCVCFLTP